MSADSPTCILVGVYLPEPNKDTFGLAGAGLAAPVALPGFLNALAGWIGFLATDCGTNLVELATLTNPFSPEESLLSGSVRITISESEFLVSQTGGGGGGNGDGKDAFFAAAPDLFGAGNMKPSPDPPPTLAFFTGGPSSGSSFLNFGRLTINFFGPFSSLVFFRAPFGFGSSTERPLDLTSGNDGGSVDLFCSVSDSLSE